MVNRMMKKYYQQTFVLVAFLNCLNTTIHADEYQPTAQNFNASAPPLLTMEQLSQTAMQCRNDIVQLHRQRATIPREQMRDYSIALGVAADKCDAIINVFMEVQKASQDYAIYQNHLQKLQSLASTPETSSAYGTADTQPYYVPPSTRFQEPIVDMSSSSPNNPVYQPLGEN